MAKLTADKQLVILLLRYRTETPSRISKVYMTYRKIFELTGIHIGKAKSFVRTTMSALIPNRTIAKL